MKSVDALQFPHKHFAEIIFERSETDIGMPEIAGERSGVSLRVCM